jgi:uncharacterized membrane protein YhaH (DUF805 family)
MLEQAMDWRTFLFSFDGRIDRAQYWLSLLLTLVLLVAAFAVGATLHGILDWLVGLDVLRGEVHSPPFLRKIVGEAHGPPVMVAVFMAAALVNTWIALAVGAKRLHDRDRSGWWIVLFYFAPALLNMTGNALGGMSALTLGLGGVAIWVWGFVELGCLKGSDGPNRYGPAPNAAPLRKAGQASGPS